MPRAWQVSTTSTRRPAALRNASKNTDQRISDGTSSSPPTAPFQSPVVASAGTK